MKELINPLGIKGFAFVEFTSPKPEEMETSFRRMGFQRRDDLFFQGRIRNYINLKGTYARKFAGYHGPSIVALGFKVEDSQKAYDQATQKGCLPFKGEGLFPVPTIYGLGDSLIYFVDDKDITKYFVNTPKHEGLGLDEVDHLTWNVEVGQMDKWCQFLSEKLGFREARFFDIKGLKTGLISKVMRSPCGTFSIPVNEPTDSKSQIQEYLDVYKGPGVQHLAYRTPNIIGSVSQLQSQGISFLTPPPDVYYELVKERVPFVKEPTGDLKKLSILIDGDQHGYLLQIFTKNTFGPIFFEIIQRAGHDGFGEGNFQTLFDAIERDQIERGVLSADN